MGNDSNFGGNDIQQKSTQTKPEKYLVTGLVLGAITFILTITYVSISYYQLKTGFLDHGHFLFLLEILYCNIIIAIFAITGVVTCLRFRKRMKTTTFVMGLLLSLSYFLFILFIVIFGIYASYLLYGHM